MHEFFPKSARFLLTLLLALAASASSLPSQASAAESASPASPPAQTASQSDQDSLAARQGELLAQLDDLAKKRETLLTQSRKLQGDQLEAATLQIRDVEKDIRRILADLPELVEKMREAGLDTKALSERTRDLLQGEAKILKSRIEALQADVIALQKDQEKLESTELVARKDRIAKQHANLDVLLGDLYDNTERAQRMGIDATADRAYLDKAIENRASAAAGEIKLAVEQLDSIRAQLGKAATADKEKLEAQIAGLQAQKEGATASLTNLVSLMKKRGLDDTSYSELLIRTTGQLTTETLSADVAKAFLEHQIADGEKWLRERGVAIGFQVLVALAILIGFWLLAKLVRRGVRKALSRPDLGASKLLQRFAARASGALVMLVGILVVLSQFNIEVTHMLAGLGIAGFIVGFALQDVLANFAAGMMILAYRPYDVGDWIEVPDAFGKVSHMNLVSTTILTGDNQKLLVPNKKIWGSVLRNVTSEQTRRVDLTFGIGYSDDIAQAERILHEIVEADERVLASPEPLIRLTELGESSVNFIVRAWCLTADYWELRWHITRRVKERFDEEGVSIPFPQRDVHLYRATAVAESG
jgi:small conductance mechanosensitive channel